MKLPKILMILVVILLMVSCVPSRSPNSIPGELTHVRLPMGYVPNVQYAPFYTAVEEGFYAEEGIELEFDYSFETDGVALVGANDLQFSLVSGEQVPIARGEGIPIVYVMAWYGKYPVAVIAKSDQNLKTPQDLAGKRVGLPGLFGANYVGLRALMDFAGLDENDLTLESIGFTQVEALAADTSQVVVGYVANEPVQLAAQGYELDVLQVSDYLELVSNGLITNEKTIAENPDLVRRMVRATMRGIQYAVEHPQEAYEYCLNHVDGLENADQDVQFQVMEASMALYQTDPYGYSNPQSWSNMQDVLLDMGMLKHPIDLEEAYSNEFIQ